MISLQHVSKTFHTKSGSFHAVNDVSLTIEKNTIHGIIGPSGAGKSTLIRLINQLEVHDTGTISVFNYEDVRKLNKESTRMFRQKVSMIFQRFNVLERLTVLQNVLLPIKFTRKVTEEDLLKANNLIKLVGLVGYEQSYPSQLSGGQLQRVGIARALINDPEILLCDEPTSALDTLTIKSILNLIKDIKEELELTVLIVTHDMNVIKEICDNVTVMANGSIVEQDTIDNIIFHPKQQITKDLLGTVGINLEQFKTKYPTSNLYVLKFGNESSTESVISKISKEMALDINIIFADITSHNQGIMVVDINRKEDLKEEFVLYAFEKLGVEIRNV